MTIDLTIGEQVKQLRRVGLRPSERLVRSILSAGPAAYRPLLDLAREVALLHEDEPECFAPLHALRLLGEQPTTAIIMPLLELLPIGLLYKDEDLPASFGGELLQMIARLGAPAIAPLWSIGDDDALNAQIRGGALMALAYVVGMAPETRTAVIAGLRERLGSYDDPRVNTYAAIALGELGTSELYNDTLALYRTGKLDRQLFPPSLARQMLLAQREGRVACVRHALWERYDQHGPFASET